MNFPLLNIIELILVLDADSSGKVPLSDTTQKATPIALLLQGIGTDSILDINKKSQINLPLNKNSNKSEYLIALMYNGAEENTLTFITDRIFVNNKTNDTLEIEKKVGDFYFTNES